MDAVVIIGWSVVIASVLLVTFFVILSNRIIKRIDKRGYPSLREIVKERKPIRHRRD